MVHLHYRLKLGTIRRMSLNVVVYPLLMNHGEDVQLRQRRQKSSIKFTILFEKIVRVSHLLTVENKNLFSDKPLTSLSHFLIFFRTGVTQEFLFFEFQNNVAQNLILGYSIPLFCQYQTVKYMPGQTCVCVWLKPYQSRWRMRTRVTI